MCGVLEKVNIKGEGKGRRKGEGKERGVEKEKGG